MIALDIDEYIIYLYRSAIKHGPEGTEMAENGSTKALDKTRWPARLIPLWITIAATIFGTVVLLALQHTAFPLVYVRFIFGSMIVLYLPGYSTILALFPRKELGSISMIALSIATSLAEVSILGLVLNYTPWGITLTTITLSLLIATLTSAVVVIIRKKE